MVSVLLSATVTAEELSVQNKASLSLTQAYELALKRSEDIAIHSELIEEAEGHFYQVFSGILPKFHYVITRSEQDAPETSSSDSGATSNLLRRTTPQR